jgi:superkiller protein 3
VHSNLGDTYAAQGKIDQAREEYLSAMRLDPSLTSAILGLSDLNLNAGQYDEAARLARYAIAAHRNEPRPHVSLAWILSVYGTAQEAQIEFRKAVELAEIQTTIGPTPERTDSDFVGLSPNVADAYRSWGQALLGLENPAEALRHFERASKINPGLSDVFFDLGSAYYALERAKETVSAFEQCVSLNPFVYDAHRYLGDALLDTGLYSKAMDEYLSHMGRRAGVVSKTRRSDCQVPEGN